jgi:hypothetical protein
LIDQVASEENSKRLSASDYNMADDVGNNQSADIQGQEQIIS